MTQSRAKRRRRRNRPPRVTWRQRFSRTAVINSIVRMLWLRPWRRPVAGRITLVSPDYTGNIAAFGDHLRRVAPHVEVLHLVHRTSYIGPSVTVDGAHVGNGIRQLRHDRLRDLIQVARSQVVVTAWGAGNLRPWLWAAHRPHFVDVWHGVGFKARISNQTTSFRRYDALFAPSETIAQSFRDLRLKAVTTGYARTDITLAAANDPQAREDLQRVMEAHRLEPHRPGMPVVLFAPTVSPADSAGLDPHEVLAELDRAAQRHEFVIALRPHPVAPLPDVSAYSCVVTVTVADLPVTERLLGAVDVLVTDWSSIATDFLVVDRPVVYLDAPPPAATLFPLDASDRPGPVVDSPASAADAVVEAVRDPAAQVQRFAGQRRQTVEKAWGATVDGRNCERYLTALQEHGFLTEVS